MTVYDCCQPDVIVVTPDLPVVDIAQLMEETNLGCVIVTEKERPVGIITDRDIVLRVIAAGKQPGETFARDIMSRDLIVLGQDMGLCEAMNYMKDKGVRRMPVVDSEGRLQGIITVDDIIRLLVEEMNCIACIIQSECTAPA
jgi:CBS domain-containing protein